MYFTTSNAMLSGLNYFDYIILDDIKVITINITYSWRIKSQVCYEIKNIMNNEALKLHSGTILILEIIPILYNILLDFKRRC